MMLRSSLCIVFLFATNPSFGMQIDWRVEHPYRYYRHHSDVEIHRWAYEELKSEAPQAAAHAPISHMERKLNNPSWWDEVKIKQLAELRSAEGKTPKRPTKEMIKFGWASFLRSSPQGYVDGTCWNSKKQNHSRCDESDRLGTTGQRTRYLKPKYHNIVLKLVDADATTLSRPCLWEASSEVLLQTASEAERSLVEVPTCSETVRARIPYFDNSSDAAVMISVTSQNGAKLSTKVHVKDYLIFGLGDSFSSGEGNPEIPARLSKTRAIGPTKPRLADMDEVNGRTTFFGVPRREPADGASAAKWTDRRCHRSVYSYQNRVALQLAIAPDEKGNHHHAITFLHFACSGAEVSEDIFFAWEGRECIGRARQLHRSGGTLGRGIRHRYYMPQISKASVALCGESQPSHWSRLSDIVGRIDNKNGLSDRDHYRRQRNQFRQNPSNHCDFKREDFGMNPRLLYCRKEDRLRPEHKRQLSV